MRARAINLPIFSGYRCVDLEAYDWTLEGSPYREWQVPAAILNAGQIEEVDEEWLFPECVVGISRSKYLWPVRRKDALSTSSSPRRALATRIRLAAAGVDMPEQSTMLASGHRSPAGRKSRKGESELRACRPGGSTFSGSF